MKNFKTIGIALFIILSLISFTVIGKEPRVIIEDVSINLDLFITLVIILIDIFLRLVPSYKDNTIIGNILKWLKAVSDFLNRRK